MLSWLGMTKGEETGQSFFGGVSKRAVTLVLLSSLMLMYGVKSLLIYLIPTAYLEDRIIAVLPGVLGMLVALVYILVLERLLHDQAVSRNHADEN
ncbi:hypothetical protein PTI97_01055 [Exiguobacterium marinum]|uniref:Uncharacterized protein n=1 Tax=Exiguobacterium marinum TaxID=273528 RepID=A0ABY7X2G1_9BACL|nr:hypothetical protein [Exiguobacterium marinum]WDH76155.1 hypothetical protein PTI97_01055 [Exiguobacterium marinum]